MVKYWITIDYIDIKPNTINIHFNENRSNLLDILTVLDFYKNSKDCYIIEVILRVYYFDKYTQRDITKFMNNSLILLYYDIKLNSIKTRSVDSGLVEDDFSKKCILCIKTTNIDNRIPVHLNKKRFLKRLYSEWINQQ